MINVKDIAGRVAGCTLTLLAGVGIGLCCCSNDFNRERQLQQEQQRLTILNNIKKNSNIKDQDIANILKNAFDYKYEIDPSTGNKTLILTSVENNSK